MDDGRFKRGADGATWSRLRGCALKSEKVSRRATLIRRIWVGYSLVLKLPFNRNVVLFNGKDDTGAVGQGRISVMQLFSNIMKRTYMPNSFRNICHRAGPRFTSNVAKSVRRAFNCDHSVK